MEEQVTVSAPDHDERPLFGAMRHQIHSTQMPAPRRLTTVPAVRFTSRPRLLAGGATALAGAATAAVLAIGAASTAAPAFAATSNPNGTVTITLNDLTGVAGLNAELASMGVAIRAVPIVSGCTATAQVVGADGSLQPAGTLAVSPLPDNPRTGSPTTLDTITLAPPQTPSQTEIIAASASGIDLVGQTCARARPSCVAPAGSGSSAAGNHWDGPTTIKLGANSGGQLIPAVTPHMKVRYRPPPIGGGPALLRLRHGHRERDAASPPLRGYEGITLAPPPAPRLSREFGDEQVHWLDPGAPRFPRVTHPSS